MALAASLAHVLIDYHIGLYGVSSAAMRPGQAANLLVTCAVYGWWAIVLGQGASAAGLLSALILAAGWAGLWNGAVGLVVSPPPSRAFPYQDLAHIANIGLGSAASLAILVAMRANAEPVSWLLPSLTVMLLVTACAVQSVVGLVYRAGAPAMMASE